MSLINEMMEPCKILNRIRQDDPYGSWVDTWTEGASFNATIIKNSSTEATVAERQGIKEIFTVVTGKGFPLEYHDVFRRLSDGAIFRVTSESKDSEAPARSTVQIAKVTAERWELNAENSGST
jgi:hypothetical protein